MHELCWSCFINRFDPRQNAIVFFRKKRKVTNVKRKLLLTTTEHRARYCTVLCLPSSWPPGSTDSARRGAPMRMQFAAEYARAARARASAAASAVPVVILILFSLRRSHDHGSKNISYDRYPPGTVLGGYLQVQNNPLLGLFFSRGCEIPTRAQRAPRSYFKMRERERE